jgi:nucleotide-binding universal stress UspA family protein
MNAKNPPGQSVILSLNMAPQSAAVLPVAEAVVRHTGAVPLIVSTSRPAPLLDALRRNFPDLESLPARAEFCETTGDAAADIVRIAVERRSLCIVMPTHEGTPLKSGLSPVAEAMLRRMPCPVLLVPSDRGPAPWRLQRVVLPQDGTPDTARAIRPAVDLAHRAEASLLVLHVSGVDTAGPETPGTITAPRYVDQPHHEWPAWAQEFLDRVCSLSCDSMRLDIRMFIATGEPGPEIVRFSREHGGDLIVLPWHGCLDPHRAATLRTVMLNAPCPVLVLPSDFRGAE